MLVQLSIVPVLPGVFGLINLFLIVCLFVAVEKAGTISLWLAVAFGLVRDLIIPGVGGGYAIPFFVTILTGRYFFYKFLANHSSVVYGLWGFGLSFVFLILFWLYQIVGSWFIGVELNVEFSFYSWFTQVCLGAAMNAVIVLVALFVSKKMGHATEI